MRYKRRERETVILYNEAEENASVCTFNRKLKKKLAKLAARFPDKVRLREVTAGGECVTIFPPHTEDWKDNMSKRAKSAEEE